MTVAAGSIIMVRGDSSKAPNKVTAWTTRLLTLFTILLLCLVTQNLHRFHLEAGRRDRSSSLGVIDDYSSSSVPSLLGSFDIDQPPPPPMPSIRVDSKEDASITKLRNGATKYGGRGDKAHLGGFTDRDEQGLSYNVFNFMLGPMTIKSVLDLGCGKGFSTNEFLQRGAKVLCVEGSHDAVQHSLLPLDLVVEHDFTRGPWWPNETYDAVWSVEFFEHVGRPHMLNYLPILRKAALLFVTASGFGGWHHVEIHNQNWWRSRLEAQGFVFSEYYTKLIRAYATDGRQSKFDSQHIAWGMQVFINPEVSRRPRHHHLFGGWGCHDGTIDNRLGGAKCEGIDSLPSQYVPLLDCYMNKSQKELKIWNCAKTKDGEKIVNPDKRYSNEDRVRGKIR